MAKKLIARKDLELIIRQELRSFPGCESISSIEIFYVRDARFDTNWRFVAYTQNGEQMDAVEHASNRTQSKLRELYNLFADQ